MTLRSRLVAGLAALLLAALAGTVGLVLARLKGATPAVVPFSAEEIDRVHAGKGLTDCFWTATLSRDTFNILVPDLAVTYWIAQFKLPAGARMELKGQYPHARYMSFASYNPIGQPVDSLPDDRIAPDAGSANPFLAGAARSTARRDFTVQVRTRALQAGERLDEAVRPANTLFVPTDEPTYQVWMRVYAADAGRGPKGGVELPRPVMTLADGSRVEGAELCRAYVVREAAVRDSRATKDGAREMFRIPGASSPYHPAGPAPVEWNAFYNPKLVVSSVLLRTPFAFIRSFFDKTRRAGFYATLDNAYMTTYVDNRFGDVLVIRGKAPRTPRTLHGEDVMATDIDMRYWSFCKGRSIADGATDSCLMDEQVPLDADGRYTIVVSPEASRPANARPECGVAWMAWGIGDGVDNPHGGYLAHRHLKPVDAFKTSLWATKSPGDERAVLGEYYPEVSYESRQAFEARGCRTTGATRSAAPAS